MQRSPYSRRARLGLIGLVASFALVAGACGSSDKASDGSKSTGKPSGDTVKAAWIYVGPINDGGWTQAHNEGRLAAEKELGTAVETTYKESVPEGPEAVATIEDLIKDGNQIIFATSFGFGDAIAELAVKYPDVKFEHATGVDTTDNIATYYGASEDTIYLTGMAAGKAASDGGTIGFVAPFPIPEVIRHINAFALGVQEVNADAKVKVVWTNTWFDPAKERQAADSLVDEGVEVIASGQDSPASGEAAKAAKLPFVGYDSDQSKNLSDIWLTASLYHWGPYYSQRIKAVADGTWKTGEYYGDLSDGFVSLAPFGDQVTQETQDLIAKKQEALTDGSFYEFVGPLTDQDGKEKVADGVAMTLPEILSMDWFVKGVVGSPQG